MLSDQKPTTLTPTLRMALSLIFFGLLGCTLGAILGAGVVTLYYRYGLPPNAGGGDAGFALIGEWVRGMVCLGTLGAIAGGIAGARGGVMLAKRCDRHQS